MTTLTPDQIAAMESAAANLLTDEEIIASLAITEQDLADNYEVVERARLKLKQQLNAQRIMEAGTRTDTTELVQSIPRNNKQKISSRGGARKGAGRPKGSGNKISITSLLKAIENETGDTLENLLAQGYSEAIASQNNAMRQHYEKLFMNKVVADQVDINIGETEDRLAAKQAAFAEAMSRLSATAEQEPPSDQYH